MKAWQRTIREQRAASDGDLLGRWWDGIDTDISRAEVRPISYKLAESVILEYEWLGCMPAISSLYYGIFFDGTCGGAVVYGPEYSENLGKVAREQNRKCADWSRYGYEGKMILLARGACAHWAHPHAGSKLIRRSMELLPPQFEIVTATIDPAAGEIGTIYQAAGFLYVGSMRASNDKVKNLQREAWLINGKIVAPRTLKGSIGSATDKNVLAHFPAAVKVAQHSKGRYFAFRGSASTRRRHQRAIQHLIKPYPKRPSPEEDTATNAEARFDPVWPLQVYAESA